MQHFAKARQYMSKNHHFSRVMMLRFYFGCFLTGLLLRSNISKVQYSCNIKGTYVPSSILFTEFSLDKKIKEMWHSK